MRTIELLSPAKDLAAAVAAVDYGADAIYMGGSRFGARRAAANSIDDIARAAEYAHRYGVRVHAALNTVIFDDELEAAEAQARELIAAGVDALIVQDMALRRMDLPVELHASTQTGNTTPEGVRFLQDCGFARVILERSLTLDDIRRIRAATSVELECFVHGAICVGHSGRCFLSRSMSSRSGNRGECSQPCRLPYDLKDGAGRTVMSGKHLLSVRDLDLSDDLERLIDAGVASFKIEGRLKDVRYIKNIVASYRRRLDGIIGRRTDLVRPSVGRSVPDFTPDAVKSFTRGASRYMLYGKCGGVASFDTPKAVGEPIGRIAGLSRRGFSLDRPNDLAAGDGICIVGRNGTSGTNVNGVEGGTVIPNRTGGIDVGAEVYRNYDHAFSLALDRSRTRRTIDADARITLSADGATLSLRDCEGVEVAVTRRLPLAAADDPDKMERTARRIAARSGDTIFSVRGVEAFGSEHFAPASLLAEMRREAFDALMRERLRRPVPHRIMSDDGTARYPGDTVTRYENVTNRMAAEFYRAHGAQRIEPPLETSPTSGERVMVSSYCIRRELGQCLKEAPALRGDLYIEHGAARYRLVFDCSRCEMSLVDCGRSRKNNKQP